MVMRMLWLRSVALRFESTFRQDDLPCNNSLLIDSLLIPDFSRLSGMYIPSGQACIFQVECQTRDNYGHDQVATMRTIPLR